MSPHITTRLATLIVVATGCTWGFYWLPVRELQDAGLDGAWGSLGIVASASLVLLPLALSRWHDLKSASLSTLFFIALGGFAFVLYSIAFAYGQVAIVILMFFLTPVWSTLIGRFVLGWLTPPLRFVAIAAGLLGLGIMLGADGTLPLPKNLGEWLSLVSGGLWAIASVGLRVQPKLQPLPASFVFAMGATLGAAVLAPLLAPVPDWERLVSPVAAMGWALAGGAFWWGLTMVGLMWAAPRLDPARVGILLMIEILIGAVSAALLAGEMLSPLELTGGALVIAAGVLEVWPVRAHPPKP